MDSAANIIEPSDQPRCAEQGESAIGLSAFGCLGFRLSADS
jgi:hypothetical protein